MPRSNCTLVVEGKLGGPDTSKVLSKVLRISVTTFGAQRGARLVVHPPVLSESNERDWTETETNCDCCETMPGPEVCHAGIRSF